MSSMVSGDPFEEEPMTAAVHLPDKRDWTADDVASLPEDLHYELINGRLALSPSPLPFHQFVGNEVVYSLRAKPAEVDQPPTRARKSSVQRL